jgi:hypothetical protein
MDFPTNVIFIVSLDLVSIRPESRCQEVTPFGETRISSSHQQLSTIIILIRSSN